MKTNCTVRVKGDLAVRSGLNFARMEGDWYRPDEVFKADSHGWPGDWEGRVILALTLLEQSVHRTSAYLDEIISMIPAHLNEKGYFGPILPEKTFDEQHFGGHSWMIRALAEYYKYKKQPDTLEILEHMVRNFILPVRGSYAQYPIEPGKRFEAKTPWILSHLQTKTQHHAETSDAGCCFIMIDGATAAYELLPIPELREVIDEMIARYMEMDLEALNIQTHATLSAARGILRLYRLTNDQRYLDMALTRYKLYRSAAWTECYGNFNWFGAPRWTEPCGIIDSFIVAVSLWQYTGDVSFLNDSHLIYYNALSHGNRINGSFGSDRCCGAVETEDNLFLAPINYETYWCCTMRGGEGFARAIEYCCLADSGSVTLPFFHSFEADVTWGNESIAFEMISAYPFRDKIEITVKNADLARPLELKLFKPDWAGNAELSLNGEKQSAEALQGFIPLRKQFQTGDVITLDLDMSVRCEETRFDNCVQGYHKFFYGPMLLGHKAEKEINTLDGNKFENYAESKYKSAETVSIPANAKLERVGDGVFRTGDIELSALCSVRDMTREDTMRQILFHG
ncbi:MAG: glycoside hydrolase family 127 protein [Oscillospiraceae bacterium]|nr:glycoside hydrolase family 127 protein [Oscillospiraceae bacterium]